MPDSAGAKVSGVSMQIQKGKYKGNIGYISIHRSHPIHNHVHRHANLWMLRIDSIPGVNIGRKKVI